MSGSFDDRSIFPKFLRHAINRFANLLYEKTILVLVVLLVAGIACMVWIAYRVKSNLIMSSALSSASLYTQALAEFRSIYTSEVEARLRPHQVEVTHDYKKKVEPSPFPQP